MTKIRMVLVATVSLPLLAAACSSSAKTASSTPPSSPPTSTSVVASSSPGSTSAAPTTASAAASGLSGTWHGSYSGSYTGSFTLTWTQNGNQLQGTIAITNPAQTLPINGSLSGSQITFGTLGSTAITYTGSVSGTGMSGSYTVGGQPAGNWTAAKA